MTKRGRSANEHGTLAEKAEQQLLLKSTSEQTGTPEARKLLHELEVYHIELEMQNDELNKIHAELEDTLQIYEFAPTAYFTLDAESQIIHTNHAAARLLGLSREKLYKKRFVSFIELASRVRFIEFLKKTLITNEQSEEFTLHLANRSMFIRVTANADAKQQKYLVIVNDTTELRRTDRLQKESNTGLRILNFRREKDREDEIKYLARELHDGLGQLLSVLRLNTTTLDLRFGDDNPSLRTLAEKMVTTLDTAIDMTRNLSKRLRPAALSLGIAPALKWLAQDFTVNTGIVCNFYALAEFAKLDEHRSLMIFRIVQESLTNVLRHAKANQIDVTMSQEREYIEVKIRDNGKGFNPDHNDPISSGIIGMKERALALQGTLDIVSAENAGTLVTLHLPLKALY